MSNKKKKKKSGFSIMDRIYDIIDYFRYLAEEKKNRNKPRRRSGYEYDEFGYEYKVKDAKNVERNAFRTNLFIFGVVCFAIGLIIGIIVGVNARSKSYSKHQETEYKVSAEATDGTPAFDDNADGLSIDVAESAKETTSEDSELSARAKEIFAANEAVLTLVNEDNEFTGEVSDLVTIQEDGDKTSSEKIVSPYNQMINAAADSGYNLYIVSGYRSRSQQESNVKDKVYALMDESPGMTEQEALTEVLKETQRPGQSEHHTGLALDVIDLASPKLSQEQANMPGNKWMQEHCWEYGFIMRYPADKADVTGISYEPWHIRYVGTEAAQFITENNLTLEEFYELL